MVLAAMVLACGLVAGGQIASADSDGNGHRHYPARPERGNAAAELPILRNITWEH
jgi:hypothetical protein